MTMKYIWFDLGYTLVYSKREKRFQDILLKMDKHIDISDIELAYHLTDKFFMREYKGLLCKAKEKFMPIYLEKLLETLHVEVDDIKYLNTLLNIEYIKEENYGTDWIAYDSVINVLSALKSNSIKVGLISNWDNTSRSVLKQNNLDELLDDIIISSEVGYEKPYKEIFTLALRKAKVQPDECLFVGDNYYDDVIGSNKVKMKALLINPYGKIGIEELNYPEIISNISELPEYLEKNYNLQLYEGCEN